MRISHAFPVTTLIPLTLGATLESVCTKFHVQASLPRKGALPGIGPIGDSVQANPVYNVTVFSTDFPTATIDFCNVTFQYNHIGKDDVVNVMYWLPSPDKYKKRYLATGGGGFAINSGTRNLGGGVQYGAVSGITDGGFGGFDVQFSKVFLLANWTINYDALYMFGYKAIGEQTKVGKAFSRNFYGLDGTQDKIFTYYQGCSEGGREGMSQVQQYPDEYDGVVAGAPAFRFAQQQVQHLYSNVVEQTLDYYPPTCELDKIANETIAVCDPLDGKTDGVVARTDLCLLHFNLSSVIGKAYHCPAATIQTPFEPGGSTPEQTGKVTAQGVAVAQKIIDGLHDSKGRHAYISYQPGTTFADAVTKYNPTTQKWELSINGMGGEYVAKFLQLVDLPNLPSLEGVTYDILRDWSQQGWLMYKDTLQTTLPDITSFQAKGGRLLHWHGESDNSIPTGSSVHYYESVRKIMYPGLGFDESTKALGDWYRLFLIPGAAHCSPNPLQPNGPFPGTNLEVMIDWVENGVKPEKLKATVPQGPHKGENEDICAWPLRPYWGGKQGAAQCVFDKKSFDTWMYKFDAYKLPVY